MLIARFDSLKSFFLYHWAVRRYFSDSLLALTFAPELVATRNLYVTVDLQSDVSLGKTVADFYGAWEVHPNMQVALEVQAQRFIDMVVDRIASLASARIDSC